MSSMDDAAVAPTASAGRDMSDAVYKEHFNYEGRHWIEKAKDRLRGNYDDYLREHPEIVPLLHDVMLNLLIHQPERPLKEIRSYVRSRQGL